LNLFLTGATGYIGSSLARQLIQAGHSVRGLVRDPARTAAIEAFGIVPVIGTLDDGELLSREARAADGVVNAADSMHRAALDALIEGLRGSAKPLLHTSGVGMVSRDVVGDRTIEQVVDDALPIVAGPHPAQQALRDQELRALNAATLGVRAIVLSNSLIYGTGLGLATESVQVPMMVLAARQSGEARFVGGGLNRWSTVHVADMAALYLLALEQAPAGAFYFVENGEASFTDIAAAIARRLGLGRPRSLPLDEASAVFGQNQARFLLGSDARVRSTVARRDLGWAPQHSSLTDWITAEMPVSR
jgi:nucleoside-diphosphate-sugar epimerase